MLSKLLSIGWCSSLRGYEGQVLWLERGYLATELHSWEPAPLSQPYTTWISVTILTERIWKMKTSRWWIQRVQINSWIKQEDHEEYEKEFNNEPKIENVPNWSFRNTKHQMSTENFINKQDQVEDSIIKNREWGKKLNNVKKKTKILTTDYQNL